MLWTPLIINCSSAVAAGVVDSKFRVTLRIKSLPVALGVAEARNRVVEVSEQF